MMRTSTGLPGEGRVRTVSAHRPADDAARPDRVAVEEPLEIRVGDAPLAVTMRTPGDDADLILGFLITEGVLLSPAELERVVPSARPDESRASAILAPGVSVDPARFLRHLFVSSSCGVCGKASIENVRLLARPAGPFTLARPVLAGLTALLRQHQPVFDETGGLHAAGVFSLEGSPVALREDVGRHNAVDKAIGAAAAIAWPLPPGVLVISGRQSFEIVQKAAMAGIGGVVGISAPSSLAVDLATGLGMLLVGFARGEGYTVYAGQDRLTA